MIAEMKGVADRLDEVEPRLREAEESLNALLLELPNIPDPATPYGESEHDNPIVQQHGEEFTDPWRKPHWELGEALGIIDFERGVKLSGSRFYVLNGAGARLQRALIACMLDLHIDEHGYTRDLPAVHGEGRDDAGTPASCRSSATTSTTTPRRTSGWCPPPRCR